MNILLDTHIFLWALGDIDKLTAKQKSLLCNKDNSLYVSAMSLAEMSIKKSLGKLNYQFNPIEAAASLSASIVPFEGADAMTLEQLKWHHKDPFDRMIISQALNNKFALMTVDTQFKHYPCRLV